MLAVSLKPQMNSARTSATDDLNRYYNQSENDINIEFRTAIKTGLLGNLVM